MAGKSAHPNGNSVRPKNWLVPVVLLILKESSSYGYELLQRVSGFGFGEMNPGTLYRTLRYMEESGIVISTWETTNRGPARRMYSITDAGEDYLDFWSSEQLQHQRHLINAFFRV